MPYIRPIIAGYNANPPIDDGAEVSANQITWAKHINKIGDPLRTYANAINGAVEDAFDNLYVPTITALKALASPSNGDAVVVTESGRAGTFVFSGTAGTENGGTTFSATDLTPGLWHRRFDGPVDVRWFGASGDGVSDDTLAFERAFASGRSIDVPAGTYRLIRELDTRDLGWGNGRTMTGEGRGNTILNFESVSGLYVDNEQSRIASLWVRNADFTLTGVPATDRAAITAGTHGIKIGRSHVQIDHVEIWGFARGIYHASRYYSVCQNVRALYNLIGLYADDADAVAPAFNSFFSCEFRNSYASNVYITEGRGWDFYSCSLEVCSDNDADLGNYPNGGVYIGPNAQASFTNPWVEGANVYLEGACDLKVHQWRSTFLGAPCDIRSYFNERRTRNLVSPIWTAAPAWPDTAGARTVSKLATNNSGGKRYTSISDATSSGSKDYISENNEIIWGLDYPPDTFGGWVQAGIWVQFKTADIPSFFLDIEVEDTNETRYSVNTQARLYPTGKPDLTAVDEWQYVGFFSPIRESFKTAFPLRRVRMRIRYGGDVDFSGSARVMWLADPVLRMFVNEGHPAIDPA